jgi:methyl-accepting chemotaxis protein
MSVARRAVIGFALILVISMSACSFVFVEAIATRGLLTTYYQGTDQLKVSVWAIRTDFYAFDDQMNMYVAVLAGGDTAEQRKIAEVTYGQAVAARKRLDADIVRAEKLNRDGALATVLARVKKDVAEFGGFADQTRAAAQGGDLHRAIYLSTVGNLAPSDDIMPALDEAAKIVDAAAAAEVGRIDQRQAFVQKLTAAGGSVLFLVICGLAFAMRRWILRPIFLLQRNITGIATGERSRSERLHLAGRDEFAALAEAFNTMLDALADQEAELASNQRLREAQLQAGYEQQRAAEQQVRVRAQSVVDETASTVRDDLAEVMEAVQVVRQAANTIDEKVTSADTVTRTVVENARTADRVVNDLETSLRRVAGMTELIAGVADQTKLLALNATIEAARAGRAGRGFSVVADEVKQLATTTATSTGEIVATIASLERDAAAMTQAITAMSQALGGVDEATSALKVVAQEQHALVARLDHKVSESIERIEGMATLAERLERRAHQRVQQTGGVRLRGPMGVVEGSFGDLSEGGLLCTTTTATGLRTGAIVDAQFEIGGERFNQRAQVLAGTGPANEVRLQFVNPSPALVKSVRRLTGERVGV